MDAATVEDVIYLALTFILAITVTVAILVWSRATSSDRF